MINKTDDPTTATHEEPKIVGVLSWFDESAHWLAVATAGFARVCDHIVAVDGAYSLYPGARPRSHPQQAEAILAACEGAGIGCTVHRPQDVFWGNEIEKRNLTLKLAGAICRPGVDWVLVFDADCHILKAEPEVMRHQLRYTDCNVADYTLLEGRDYLPDAILAEYANTRDIDHEWTDRTRDVYRWDPTLVYGPQHWIVSREVDGVRSYLRGPWEQELVEPVHHLDAALAIYHRTNDRTMKRRQNADHYYKLREHLGIESQAEVDAIGEELRNRANLAAEHGEKLDEGRTLILREAQLDD